MATLARRTLRLLGQFPSSTVTLRQVYKGLKVSLDDGAAVCDYLCETGHLSLLDERTRRNKTLTVTYIVNSTDPEGGETDLGARLKRVASVAPPEPDPDEPPF